MDDPDVWLPIVRHPYFVNGSRLLTDLSADGSGVRMWGRMRPGATPAIVEEELRTLAATLRAQHPKDIWEHERLASESAGRPGRGGGSTHGTGRPPASKLYAVLALAGALVLLILAVACGNLGSLLLARGVARDREIGIRVSRRGRPCAARPPVVHRKPAARMPGIGRGCRPRSRRPSESDGDHRRSGVARRGA